MKPELWIDTNDCSERYHEFRRDGLGEPLKLYHVDGTECKATEFGFWPNTAREGEVI
jgi:hypothetical protein